MERNKKMRDRVNHDNKAEHGVGVNYTNAKKKIKINKNKNNRNRVNNITAKTVARILFQDNKGQ